MGKYDGLDAYGIFGDLMKFHPHVHVLAADGVFGPDGTFVSLPPVHEELRREGFRQAVLQSLAKEWAISEERLSHIPEWRHCGGFSCITGCASRQTIRKAEGHAGRRVASAVL